VTWRVVYQQLQRDQRGSRTQLTGACFLLRDDDTDERRGLLIEAEQASPVELRRIANSFLEQGTPPSHVVVDRHGVVAQVNSD
jgi:hypothetical protein